MLVPLILGMVVLYQSTKSSIQAIQEDSAQRYVDTVRDRLSVYFDKWKVTVDALSKMPEVKSKDWGKLKPILNAISSAIRDDQGKVIGALCTSMAADALNYQAGVMLADFEQHFDTNSLLLITSTDEALMYHYQYDTAKKKYRNFADDPMALEEVANLPKDIQSAISTSRKGNGAMHEFS